MENTAALKNHYKYLLFLLLLERLTYLLLQTQRQKWTEILTDLEKCKKTVKQDHSLHIRIEDTLAVFIKQAFLKLLCISA